MERKKRFFDWLYAVTIVVSPVAITLALIVNLGFAGFLLPLLSFLSFSEKTVDVILVVVGSLAIYVEGIVASLYWLLFPYVLAQQKEYEKEELLSRKRKYFLARKIRKITLPFSILCIYSVIVASIFFLSPLIIELIRLVFRYIHFFLMGE